MKKHWSFFYVLNTWLCLCMLLLSKVVLVLAGIQRIGKISPGFQGSQMNWIDKNGKFLVSNKQQFGFGFVQTSHNNTLFQLAIVHMDSTKIVWTANRESPVSSSDKFVFDEKGNVFLQKGKVLVWSTNTSDMRVSSMELQDNGNLVLLGNDSNVIWQSFDYPTDTLLPMQNFTKGMKLISEPDSSNNLSYVLEIDSHSGNVILSIGLQSPQPYWSMQNDIRNIVNENGDDVAFATLDANSWKFYDSKRSLLWQFIFADASNATWIAVLGSDGFITFNNLQNKGSIGSSTTRIPQDSCSTPQPCGSYNICIGDRKCSCPSVLSSRPSCEPGFVSPCNSKSSFELMEGDDGLSYFALGLLQPSSKTDLIGCKSSCSENCSCLAMFFHISSGNCFMLDRIGSFVKTDNDTDFVSYVKVSRSTGTDTDTRESGNMNTRTIVVVVIIVVLTLFVISGMLYVGLKYLKKNKNSSESPVENSDNDDDFLESLTSMPIRFSFNDLETATNNFAVKLGQGGFGSVYKGILSDGTQIAVKKLEGVGQGKKEFRVEVSIIGSIHHHHLVRLKGFCAEGSHKLLVYEFMENGSLDKWIFKKHKKEQSLDWNTRYNIALGTAKGLAYLHEDCDSKIVHCDIKPENVLLDNNFEAKVSDFGLAKLMNREQSHVFTTMRGTRGYLAPEWITNYAISEKSDVYSYGMVLLEIIGGRKNYDANENSEKSHFPSFAYKMMEQGKMEELVDCEVKKCENDVRIEIGLNVAFLCIQEDMSLRPSMNKVVQMLEGLCDVPKVPKGSPLGSKFYLNLLRPTSESGTSSEPIEGNSDAYLSAVRLSGPR